MTESALERTPVEIWTLILGHAIASPLSPFLEDGTMPYGLIENLDSFANWCYSSKRLRNTILRLRSVCRTWSDILKGVPIECAFLNLLADKTIQEQVPRPTRRLYVGTPTVCLCGQGKRCMFSHLEDIAHLPAMTLDSSTLLGVCSPNIKILMLARGCPQLPLDFLIRLPNIVALSIDDSILPHPQTIQTFPSHVAHISHLRLCINNAQHLTQRIEFPSVRYLSLYFPYLLDGEECQSFFTEWTFKSLRTLFLLAHLEQYTLQAQWIPKFLLRHRKDLLELGVSHYPIHDNNHAASRVTSILDLFHCCPNVTTIGMNMQVFEWMEVAGTWQPSYWKRRPIVLLHGLYPGEGLSPQSLASLSPIRVNWRAEKIVFAIGWSELGVKKTSANRWKGLFSRSRKDSFSILNDISIPVLDQYGTSLQSFLEG